MTTCAVCGCSDSRAELVREVFEIGGDYSLVERIPSEVCTRCGEQSFSRETTEKVRQMLHEKTGTKRSVMVDLYEFV